MGTTTAPQRPVQPRLGDLDVVAAAQACVEREAAILDAEREAFAAFRKRVSGIDSQTAPASVAAPARRTPLRRSSPSTPSASADVRRAYRETVMASDHYESEYGDDCETSLRVEFGPELAAALCGGGAFTPLVKERLLAAVDATVENRRSVRATLAREERALEAGRETLADVREEFVAVSSRPFLECTPDERRRLRDDLVELAERCESFAASRQAGELHTTATFRRSDDERSLSAYLYRSLDVRYPLLSEAATTSARIERVRSRLDSLLEQ